MFSKVLIANRGEIALRIIRACRELEIETVAVFSVADRESLHVKLADEAICIGDRPASESYLNVSNIIAAARNTGAKAIHPGYGFLAENHHFAEICKTYDITFIGPEPEAIELMGDKVRGRELARRAGIPLVPGSEGGISNYEKAVAIAQSIGYPVIVKAAAGGGGRGMRLAHSKNELKDALEIAKMEAKAAFGNDEIYIEKYITEPRHIEIQILADEYGRIIHLGERDCSLQRRNQKLLEESPSIFVDAGLRQQMGEMAINLAHSADYSSLGTVEFLVDKHKNCYFIEMNTRIQVEHPVTEMVTGIDLVKEQIKIAQGRPLEYEQDDIMIKGWAIECRINAEDPQNNFCPAPGKIGKYIVPGGPGTRVDSAAMANHTISPFYDSLIAKLICWGNDRNEAILRMKRALGEFTIENLKTTIPFHKKVLNNAFYQKGEVYTNFIQRRMGNNRF